jgi:hypothetical protein
MEGSQGIATETDQDASSHLLMSFYHQERARWVSLPNFHLCGMVPNDKEE